MFDRKLTVLIDSREKYPLLFPETILYVPPRSSPTLLTIATEKATLKTGDYALSGYETACLVERKASLLELTANFASQDYGRMTACLERLRAECREPILVVECTPSQLCRSSVDDLTFVKMFRACAEHGVAVWFVPSTSSPTARRNLGHLLLLKMIASVDSGR